MSNGQRSLYYSLLDSPYRVLGYAAAAGVNDSEPLGRGITTC